MSIDLVVYHKNCMDGMCAAWLLHKLYPDAEYLPASYGDSPPPTAEKHVIIADFSYPRDILEGMYKECASLRVFDHHKTSEENLKGLDFCVFDQNKSGAGLILKHFISPLTSLYDNEIQLKNLFGIVGYVQDRDLGKFKFPHSREVNAAFQSYPISLESFDAIEKKHLNIHKKEGEAILRYQKSLVELIASNAHSISICGEEGLAVNSGTLISEVGHALAQRASFGCMYFFTEGKMVYSLRSVGDFDVSELAKKMGGGGHKNAAGFTIVTYSENFAQ